MARTLAGLFSLTVALAWCIATAQAEVDIDWVTVGDPGNACDIAAPGCFGAVTDPYRIGRYEVTNAQYAEFLKAVATTDTYGLYNTDMGSGYGGITRSGSSGSYSYNAVGGREDMPVNFVSWYDAVRFANWLHNGQPVGVQDATTTEDGAYTMIVEDYDLGQVITRNPGATIFLTSEDEWYKAAYYDAGTLWYNPYPFADGFYGAACEVDPGTTSHSANCQSAVGDLTEVGAYTASPSEYGTFDQGGNVWEWNEAIIYPSSRGLRGGSADNVYPYYLAAWTRHSRIPTVEVNWLGFRVASPGPAPPVPSLSPVGILLLGSLLALTAWPGVGKQPKVTPPPDALRKHPPAAYTPAPCRWTCARCGP